MDNLREMDVQHVLPDETAEEAVNDVQILNLHNDEPKLTQEQIQAFQEAFELFDKNGGGTIDASELQKTLDDVGIFVNGDDLYEIMMSLDHDGNGEVDFDEFLNLMTNTDLFVAAITEKDEREEFRRRIILFDALTEFMKKQALKGAQEIIGYYSKKYKKVVKKYGTVNKGAHVIGHYSDGAKVIGLTDVELYKQLKKLNNNETLDKNQRKSPYACNQYTGMLKLLLKEKQQQKEPRKPTALGGCVKKKKPRVTLKIIGLDRMESSGSKERQSIRLPKLVEPKAAIPKTLRGKKANFKQLRERKKSITAVMKKAPILHLPGWTSQQMIMNNVDIRIQPGWTKIPIVRMNKLKKITSDASEKYYTRVACDKLATNLKFYRCLNTRKPHSEPLSRRIKECMVTYSAATADNSVGRVDKEALERVFISDAEAQHRKSCFVTRSKQKLAQEIAKQREGNSNNEFLKLIDVRMSTGEESPPIVT